MTEVIPKQEIGIVTINYNPEGVPIGARFDPSIKVDTDVVVKELLKTAPKTVTEAQKQAEVVMANWFARVEQIELADRETGLIQSSHLYCEEWKNGIPKTCQFKFEFVTHK